uniref:Uncharacterized protein n=1 Tax=Caenorhabditis japonica TaxID=281687 RepID=A0A8R1IA77_CAEJA
MPKRGAESAEPSTSTGSEQDDTEQSLEDFGAPAAKKCNVLHVKQVARDSIDIFGIRACLQRCRCRFFTEAHATVFGKTTGPYVLFNQYKNL